jgi:hypothetical protein
VIKSYGTYELLRATQSHYSLECSYRHLLPVSHARRHVTLPRTKASLLCRARTCTGAPHPDPSLRPLQIRPVHFPSDGSPPRSPVRTDTIRTVTAVCGLAHQKKPWSPPLHSAKQPDSPYRSPPSLHLFLLISAAPPSSPPPRVSRVSTPPDSNPAPRCAFLLPAPRPLRLYGRARRAVRYAVASPWLVVVTVVVGVAARPSDS